MRLFTTLACISRACILLAAVLAAVAAGAGSSALSIADVPFVAVGTDSQLFAILGTNHVIFGGAEYNYNMKNTSVKVGAAATDASAVPSVSSWDGEQLATRGSEWRSIVLRVNPDLALNATVQPIKLAATDAADGAELTMLYLGADRRLAAATMPVATDAECLKGSAGNMDQVYTNRADGWGLCTKTSDASLVYAARRSLLLRRTDGQWTLAGLFLIESGTSFVDGTGLLYWTQPGYFANQIAAFMGRNGRDLVYAPPAKDAGASSASSAESSAGLSTGAIAGIACGGAALALAVLAGVAYTVLRNRRLRRENKRLNGVQAVQIQELTDQLARVENHAHFSPDMTTALLGSRAAGSEGMYAMLLPSPPSLAGLGSPPRTPKHAHTHTHTHTPPAGAAAIEIEGDSVLGHPVSYHQSTVFDGRPSLPPPYSSFAKPPQQPF